MASKSISAQTGRAALRALLHEGSPLGPLKVMAKHVGRFFQIPIPGFRPFVVFGPEAPGLAEGGFGNSLDLQCKLMC